MTSAQRRPVMEFHVAREARDFYQFDEWLFAISGNVPHGLRLAASAH